MNFPEKLKKMEMFVEPNWRQKSSIWNNISKDIVLTFSNVS